MAWLGDFEREREKRERRASSTKTSEGAGDCPELLIETLEEEREEEREDTRGRGGGGGWGEKRRVRRRTGTGRNGLEALDFSYCSMLGESLLLRALSLPSLATTLTSLDLSFVRNRRCPTAQVTDAVLLSLPETLKELRLCAVQVSAGSSGITPFGIVRGIGRCRELRLLDLSKASVNPNPKPNPNPDYTLNVISPPYIISLPNG